MTREKQFSTVVLNWFDHHGRKNLPWQQNITPYSIWVSEIMLQQTQVTTVIPYFERFIKRMPNVQALASAKLDDVLHLWSGLGYYSRARNLHNAAITIVDKHEGKFPASVAELSELPGIGRSTAGAIAAISMGIKAPILDGNVRRVLARYHTITGWPGQASVQKKLWAIAEAATPSERTADYTQAMMDLGAMVCTRGKPNCVICPLTQDCLARIAGVQSMFPSPKPKRQLPEKHIHMLMVVNCFGEVLLEKRPSTGIWGGLWSFPELAPEAELEAEASIKTGLQLDSFEQWKSFRHTFSHYHLNITPVKAIATKAVDRIARSKAWYWYNTEAPTRLGLAAPVKKLITALSKSSTLKHEKHRE
ncbi:MAG: A/G-specific adenine glycosylase [Endozoicomonas sp. (ex Botrylloides leachii)]|nr:A/G-specific adenine glycosylase [Endozoicomonas sp. (ex Botrylloides leachii)]